MARSKVRSGSFVMILAITADKPDGIPLGLVENFQFSEAHRAEDITGVGSTFPDEMVYHGTGAGSASWGRVLTIPAESYQKLKILPEHRKLSVHELITLLVVDNERGEDVVKLVDCAPESFSTTVGAQQSLRSNVSFRYRYAEHASEL